MANDTENKDERKDARKDERKDTSASQDAELSVPSEATLPVDALLNMPPPAAPRVAPLDSISAEELAALAQEGAPLEQSAGEREMTLDPERGRRLREALQEAPDVLNAMSRLTPRNLAKDTVGRGIDVMFGRGGGPTPPRYMEDS